jgi:hypothetical protein
MSSKIDWKNGTIVDICNSISPSTCPSRRNELYKARDEYRQLRKQLEEAQAKLEEAQAKLEEAQANRRNEIIYYVQKHLAEEMAIRNQDLSGFYEMLAETRKALETAWAEKAELVNNPAAAKMEKELLKAKNELTTIESILVAKRVELHKVNVALVDNKAKLRQIKDDQVKDDQVNQDAKLHQMMVDYRHQSVKLEEMEETIIYNEAKLHRIKDELVNKEIEIRQMKDNLMQQSVKLVEMEKTAVDKENELCLLKAKVAAKEKELEDAEGILKGKGEALLAADTKLEVKDGEICKLKALSSNKNVEDDGGLDTPEDLEDQAKQANAENMQAHEDGELAGDQEHDLDRRSSEEKVVEINDVVEVQDDVDVHGIADAQEVLDP